MAELDDAQVAELGRSLARLHHLASQTVQASLDGSIARLARHRLRPITAPEDP